MDLGGKEDFGGYKSGDFKELRDWKYVRGLILGKEKRTKIAEGQL